ncbi:unnamed protein product [Heligmosomoides polygyrus]|uniref:Isochorismatase domain-containing protein n=1 Tax=Heligmosomoides polygyrus TaxID=6339 RepID=A0A183G3U8_HELPZ|nr:unnamed protein product [Heligmosomoides polygyrus]
MDVTSVCATKAARVETAFVAQEESAAGFCALRAIQAAGAETAFVVQEESAAELGSGRDSRLGAIQAAGVETAFVAQEESAVGCSCENCSLLPGFSCSGGGRAAIRHRPISDPPPYRLTVVSMDIESCHIDTTRRTRLGGGRRAATVAAEVHF